MADMPASSVVLRVRLHILSGTPEMTTTLPLPAGERMEEMHTGRYKLGLMWLTALTSPPPTAP